MSAAAGALRILALNPFGDGSHHAVLAGWRRHSRHRIDIRELTGRHWKWRMRHGAWTFAQQLAAEERSYDLVWTTDMLDLAAWRGLAPERLARVPHVCYQHETQLLYPDDRAGERDVHFAFTNLLSAAAADAVWWNSAWHRDAALAAYDHWLRRFPDHRPSDALERIAQRSAVRHPGIEPIDQPRGAREGPCHLLWCARWEADKDPDTFVRAVDGLARRGTDFVLSVIGGREASAPECLLRLRREHATRIRHWGWMRDRAAYARVLVEADVVVSTARHEFFGLSVIEALSAGCFPLLPRRLAYPEVVAGFGTDGRDDGLYAGDGDDLEARLEQVVARHRAGGLWQGAATRGRDLAARYAWSQLVAEWDDAVVAAAG